MQAVHALLTFTICLCITSLFSLSLLDCPQHAACLQDEEEEEAEPAKPVKAERPSSRDFSNAQKKTNLRSEDQTFKVQEEQRYAIMLLCHICATWCYCLSFCFQALHTYYAFPCPLLQHSTQALQYCVLYLCFHAEMEGLH